MVSIPVEEIKLYEIDFVEESLYKYGLDFFINELYEKITSENLKSLDGRHFVSEVSYKMGLVLKSKEMSSGDIFYFQESKTMFNSYVVYTLSCHCANNIYFQ